MSNFIFATELSIHQKIINVKFILQQRCVNKLSNRIYDFLLTRRGIFSEQGFVVEFQRDIVYNLDNFHDTLATRRAQIHATSQNTLETFNQLSEIEKHAMTSEIILKGTTLNDCSKTTLR